MKEKEVISFSEEEKKKIADIQSKVLSITSRMGEIEIGITALDEQFTSLKTEKVELLKAYKELAEDERKFGEELRAKYGEGTYDVPTNTFTPAK
jgi:chromosome segregation ATPase|tara:strand:- start:71 stop:352 length:282 start_codon:yes stop_codon:yes gene_type:complete